MKRTILKTLDQWMEVVCRLDEHMVYDAFILGSLTTAYLRAKLRLNVKKKLAQKRVILSLTIILH